jgi:glycine dehydrogenase
VADEKGLKAGADTFVVVVQYPATDGGVHDYRELADSAHASDAMVVVATDLLALTLLAPPGEWGADVVVGNSQRFGVPLGYGGPHAAFFATKDEYKRVMPGRIIGVSRDTAGKPALRMALQTREQHIRREKATSNVCTAQVLLAVIAGMYAVWHGPEGLTRIAKRVHKLTAALAAGLERAGHKIRHDVFFDTICVEPNGGGKGAEDIVRAARDRSINLRADGDAVCIAFDETVTAADVTEVLAAFGVANANVDELAMETDDRFDERFARTSAFLTHPVFHSHHSETEMLRYMRTLESRDFSLVHGMIPLGSCTMKLNATAEMIPVTWTEIGKLHPFAPREQAPGYGQMFTQLESDLADITGFDAVSLQPNAGSQGELAGLLVIRRYHESRGEGHRNVCLIPQSAHGTNPASAVMAGLEVVVVKTDPNGNIDVADLEAKARSTRQTWPRSW